MCTSITCSALEATTEGLVGWEPLPNVFRQLNLGCLSAPRVIFSTTVTATSPLSRKLTPPRPSRLLYNMHSRLRSQLQRAVECRARLQLLAQRHRPNLSLLAQTICRSG